MPALNSKLDTSSPVYAATAEQMRRVVAELHSRTAKIADSGGVGANARQAVQDPYKKM